MILDEAYNVEDIRQEAASVNLGDNDIATAVKECLLYKSCNCVNCATIYEYLTIVKFFKDIEVKEKIF